MQQAVRSTQNVSQLVKLDCKRVEPDAYMQKWLILLFQKTDITKFLWGRLGPHNVLAVGAIALMESVPVRTGLNCCRQTMCEGGQEERHGLRYQKQLVDQAVSPCHCLQLLAGCLTRSWGQQFKYYDAFCSTLLICSLVNSTLVKVLLKQPLSRSVRVAHTHWKCGPHPDPAGEAHDTPPDP